MKKLILIFGTAIVFGCNQPQERKSEITTSTAEAVAEKPKLLSDSIFLGFRFGMSSKEAKAEITKLKAKGEKISLSDEHNKISGFYTLNTGEYITKSKIIISFVKDQLSDLQIIILDMDIPGQSAFEPWTDFTRGLVPPPYDTRGRPVLGTNSKTTTAILKGLADFIANNHGQYSTAEDADQFDYYYWTDENKYFKVWQTDWKLVEKRSYKIQFTDRLLSNIQ